MVEIKHAATICVFREHPAHGLEVLLLKRNEKLKFAPGFWVYPGGRIEPEELASSADIKEAAIIAGKREAKEETNLDIDVKSLHHCYHWTTPVGESRRFATWFFHTLIDHENSDVTIDDSEIVDYSWVPVSTIFTPESNRAKQLLPPTYISLQRIKGAQNYDDVIREFNRTGPITVAPRVLFDNGVFCSMYPGDSGYESSDSSKKETLHRLTGNMLEGNYKFHYSDHCEVPSITGGIMF
jgi:8-oxo-dGTP pyrophosphatase MutT (NUDIX family)